MSEQQQSNCRGRCKRIRKLGKIPHHNKRLTDTEYLDFCKRLDAAIGLSFSSPFEVEFIGDVMERDAKYHGNVKFSGGECYTINRLMQKHSDKAIRAATPSERKPKRSTLR